MFCENGILENFVNFTKKHVLVSRFNKIVFLRFCDFIKKGFDTDAFL